MILFYRVLNTVCFIAVIVLNGLAQYLPLAGRTTGEISAMYPVLITPAPYTFSIWSLIYVLLLGFVILGWLPDERSRDALRRIGPWFAVSCALNCAWLVMWHNLYIAASVFVMLGLLLTLCVMYVRSRSAESLRERLLVKLTFSVYLGWISVATIVNVSVALYDAGWNGWGLSPVSWTIALLLVALALALVTGLRNRDWAYPLVIAWAMTGIGVAQEQSAAIHNTAWTVAALLVLFAAWLLTPSGRRRQQLA